MTPAHQAQTGRLIPDRINSERNTMNILSPLSAAGLILILFLSACAVPPRKPNSGIFTASTGIGTLTIPGSAAYNPDRDEYRIGGSGQNMWNARDDFSFLWKKMRGNFILDARLSFIGAGADPHRKAGWMVRADTTADSPYADAAVHGDGLTSLQFRRSSGNETEELPAEITGSDIIRFERKGSTYIMSAAHMGEPFGPPVSLDLDLGDDVYVGLFICSHTADVFEEAVFSNVRITVPIHDDFRPYEDYIGSRLEILEFETGIRRTVFESPEPLEAPNWTDRGDEVIYNSRGLLYSLNIKNPVPVLINTGSAARNNNDHVLSPDGETIGISNWDPAFSEGYNSRMYTIPRTGGEPQLVTEKSPSYLHGWSPDGRHLLYTAERAGNFDIYRIQADGGSETRLTDAPGLDDGSEYSPDGKYIYFNSARTGTMQIWRMYPDGSNQEQLTFDGYHDWFPHPSPDGEQLIFLSYPEEIDAQDHPYYKQVMLRIMPASGGNPTVVAYLYGGQGSFNVPAWSPDGKQVVFFSNSDTVN